MIWTKAKTLMVFSMLALLTAAIGGCFHPYRYHYDDDYRRRDGWYDGRDYRNRDYDRRDRDRYRW